jgi:hypothetical protein
MKKKKMILCLLVLSLTAFATQDVPLTKPNIPRYSVGLRAGAYGIPNTILRHYLFEHPNISGHSIAFEIRNMGSKGPQSTLNFIFAFEYINMSGEGLWREEEEHFQKNGIGAIDQLTLSTTMIINIFPRWVAHPYIGLGVGIGKIAIWAEGSYTDNQGLILKDTFRENRVIPVLHLPLGLIIHAGNTFEIKLEGGFKNGFYVGGGIAYKFQ